MTSLSGITTEFIFKIEYYRDFLKNIQVPL